MGVGGGGRNLGGSEGDTREPWQALGEACPGGGTCLNRGPEEWVCLAVGGQLVGGGAASVPVPGAGGQEVGGGRREGAGPLETRI